MTHSGKRLHIWATSLDHLHNMTSSYTGKPHAGLDQKSSCFELQVNVVYYSSGVVTPVVVDLQWKNNFITQRGEVSESAVRPERGEVEGGTILVLP